MARASRALVSRLRALRRDRKLRDEEGVFVAEGVHLAREAVLAEARIEVAVHSDRLLESEEGKALVRALEARGVETVTCSDAVVSTLQEARSPQPVLVVVRRPPRCLDDALPGSGEPLLVVVAHRIQDPGNLGAILRSADAAGATSLVTTGGGADLFHPRTVRATMGSIFRLPALAADLDRARAALAGAGVRAVGASARGSLPHDRYAWPEPTALFLGGEADGLPEDVVATLDATVRIPMREGVESLSVPAAAAVILFEAARQRRATGPTRAAG